MHEGDGDLALVAVPLSTREVFTLFTTRASRRNQLTTTNHEEETLSIMHSTKARSESSPLTPSDLAEERWYCFHLVKIPRWSSD
jgi:hypothetical protein